MVLDDFRALANREQRKFGEFRSRRLVLENAALELSRMGNNVLAPTALPAETLDSAPQPTPSRRTVTGHGRDGMSPQQSGDTGDHLPMADAPVGSTPPGDQSAKASAVLDERVEPMADQWIPEDDVDVAGLILGTWVRHRAFGSGVLLSVERNGRSTQLLIHFESVGDKWIALGLGRLEFASTQR